MMKLTPRLQTIANLIPEGAKVGDVGSDHGYLVAYLVEQEQVSKAIASDINQGPVDNALSTLKENNLQDKIEVRLGGGLEPYVNGEIDIAVIAGMGGMLIRDIISDALVLARTLDFLILQPMTQQSELRRWLVENGFELFNERNIREGNKYYEIFCVRIGVTQVADPIQYEIGFEKECDLMAAGQREEYLVFLQHKIKKYQKIKKEIEHKGSEGSSETLEQVAKKLQKIEEVLSDVCQW
jgi:tRNA (adenine22-N1)-methyltransferase